MGTHEKGSGSSRHNSLGSRPIRDHRAPDRRHKKESGVSTVDLIKLIGGLEEQTTKITAKLNEAKKHIKGQGAEK
uniref:Uncharacterized protein n=1 Tax=uncultured organism MedDCM-OCT-S11-C29 TaxID=743658 RepID=D6PLC3_9ZZZZ|nr:hypothetical protein [uncultured organism MedDCM-OCT-S11-C29]